MIGLPRRRRKRLLHLKDLLNRVSALCRTGLRLCRTTETWHGLSIDSARVVVQVVGESRRTSALSKGLASHVSAELSDGLLGSVGRLKRGMAYLLISQGLLSRNAGEKRRRADPSKGLASRASGEP